MIDGLIWIDRQKKFKIKNKINSYAIFLRYKEKQFDFKQD